MQHFFEDNFRPFFIIAYKNDANTLCDKDDNETNLVYKAKRFETKDAAEDYLKILISRKTRGERAFAPNHIGVTWEKEDFTILQITKNDWEEVWQNGGNEQLRKSPESSNIIRTIINKGKSGKTLYRIIDNKDRLYSDKKEHIVDLRITCTTSSKESLLIIAASLNRDAKAIVEFSSDTIAYEMKRTNSIFTEEFEHLLFGKFKVIHQEKPIVLKDDYGYLHELEYFKAYPLDQSGKFAKELVKKRVNHYNDDRNDTLNNRRRVSNLLYKKTKIEEGQFMDLFNRILKEADETKSNQDLLKKYEDVNDWYFIDEEDFSGLDNVAKEFAKVCNEMFGNIYHIEQFNPKTGDGSKNVAFVKVEGYGHKGEVDNYRMYLAFDQTASSFGEDNNRAINPINAYIKKNHKKSDYWREKKNFEKYLERKLKSLTSICEQNGFMITKIGCTNIREYDSTDYIYIDLNPVGKIERINNSPVEEKLQKIVELVTEGFEQLAKRDDTIYWIGHAGYESSEIIISTCLTTDQTEEYPSDWDDSGVAENSNYGQPILYLDIPNHGYANWNSGNGYITGNQVKTMNDVRKIAEKFKKYLNRLGNDIYSNSNY